MVVNYKGIQLQHQADSIQVDSSVIILHNKGQVVASYPRCDVSCVMSGQAVVYPTWVYPL